MSDFAKYTEVSVNALKFNPKSQEVIEKKQEILNSIAQHYGSKPASILFVGFSPMILAVQGAKISVTDVTDATKNYLDATTIKYSYIDSDGLSAQEKQFDWVIASDEYFTFAESEDEQNAKIALLASLAKKAVITTLRDYKNQDFRDREFSQPLAVRHGKDSKVFLEYHDMDYTNKNAWKTTVYELLGSTAQTHGAFARRSMFFKQLAKFSMDAGARDFYVHKNLMYKSLIKKNYEHVISISF
jgi:hypothetical protein